jgi:hypothetical protein
VTMAVLFASRFMVFLPCMQRYPWFPNYHATPPGRDCPELLKTG